MMRRFCSGSVDAREPREEALARVDVHERHVEVLAEACAPPARLVLAQQAVVDEHAGEPVAERAVHDQRGDGGVDSARQPADRAAVADLLADQRDLLVDDRRRRPLPARSRRRRAGTCAARRCHAACARPRGGTGSRTGRARPTRTPRPARRARTPAPRSPAAARRRCRGGSSSSVCSARQARPAAGRARAPAARCGRTPPPPRPPRGRRARAPSPACRNRCRAPGSRARAAPGAAAARRRSTPTRGRRRARGRAGCALRSSSSGASCGSSSEKTPHSRMRRAISWEYWPPKSSTSTSSVAARGAERSTPAAAVPATGLLIQRGDRRGDLGLAVRAHADVLLALELLALASGAPGRSSPRRGGRTARPRSRRWPSRSAARRRG